MSRGSASLTQIERELDTIKRLLDEVRVNMVPTHPLVPRDQIITHVVLVYSMEVQRGSFQRFARTYEGCNIPALRLLHLLARPGPEFLDEIKRAFIYEVTTCDDVVTLALEEEGLIDIDHLIVSVDCAWDPRPFMPACAMAAQLARPNNPATPRHELSARVRLGGRRLRGLAARTRLRSYRQHFQGGHHALVSPFTERKFGQQLGQEQPAGASGM